MLLELPSSVNHTRVAWAAHPAASNVLLLPVFVQAIFI